MESIYSSLIKNGVYFNGQDNSALNRFSELLEAIKSKNSEKLKDLEKCLENIDAKFKKYSTNIKQEIEMRENQEKRNHNKKFVIGLLSALIIIITLITSIFLYKSLKSNIVWIISFILLFVETIVTYLYFKKN